MRVRTPLCAIAFALLCSSTAFAEGSAVHLSIGLRAIEPDAAESVRGRVELGLHFMPDFLRGDVRRPHDPFAGLLQLRADPEWLRVQLDGRENVALRLEGFVPAPAPLVPIEEATRQLEALDPVRFLPILESVRVITNLLAAQANELIARGMSVEVGDRVETRYTPLKGLAGDIQRGQYLRVDDVTGRQFNFDVRLVLAWRPSDRVRIEAGYAVAYLSGEVQNNFGTNGPLGDRSSSYLVHGPCAAVNLDF